YSTCRDYLIFLRALLNDGTLGGVRILAPETVAELNRNQIGELEVTKLVTAIPAKSNDAEFFPGMRKKWGLASMLNTADARAGRAAAGLGPAESAGVNSLRRLVPPTRIAGGAVGDRVEVERQQPRDEDGPLSAVEEPAEEVGHLGRRRYRRVSDAAWAGWLR